MKLKLPRLGRRTFLTGLWWIGGLIIIATLASLSRQSALLDDQTARDVWAWFVPHLLPTLTLVGAAAYAGRSADPPSGEGATMLFVLCTVISLAYLYLLMDAVLHIQSTTAAMESLRRSSLWLGLLQALVTTLLGFFFVQPAAAPVATGSPKKA